MADATTNIAHRVEPRALETISILGPTIQFITPPDGNDASPCVMRGTIPAGVSIPLHSHADEEVFIAHSGHVEGLAVSGDRFEWIRIGPGDVFHVPGGAKHAFRNEGGETAVMTVVSTSKIGKAGPTGETASGKAAGGTAPGRCWAMTTVTHGVR